MNWQLVLESGDARRGICCRFVSYERNQEKWIEPWNGTSPWY